MTAPSTHACVCPPPSYQEARKGDPVSHREGVHPGHTSGRGALPAAEEGPEPADDRGIPGEPAEAVQQGCFGVSGLFFFILSVLVVAGSSSRKAFANPIHSHICPHTLMSLWRVLLVLLAVWWMKWTSKAWSWTRLSGNFRTTSVFRVRPKRWSGSLKPSGELIDLNDKTPINRYLKATCVNIERF